MNGSWLQAVKDSIPIPGPLALVLMGLGCYLVTCLIARRPLTWRWALVPGLVLSLVIESWEVWDHYSATGLAETSLLGIALRHLEDVALVNVSPVAVYTIAFFWER
jgi:hypothetical protein